MTIGCPDCGRVLEFTGEMPSFCAYCGQPLADRRLDATADDGAATRTFAREPKPAAASGPTPEEVAGYRLIRLLGRGGMGEVHEAEEVGTGRRVALKLIAPEFVASREALARFRQEGRLASTIAHPRCVFVLSADEQDGRPYIVMELMSGGSLQTLVEDRGPLPSHVATALVLDVIAGLREAHRLGIIHRDVKPSNCFLEADGRVKVGDFGLSKSLTGDSELTQSGAFLGTPLYASPEQIKRLPLDARTDVYSTVATLYFLLCGRAPFQGTDAAATLARIVSEPVPSLRLVRSEIPVALDRVVLRGLERDRDRRWRDLEELRTALIPFVPRRSRLVGMGRRAAAFFLDLFAFTALGIAVYTLVMWQLGLSWTDDSREAEQVRLQDLWVPIETVAYFFYYFLTEWAWGASPGKWLMRLRVRAVTADHPPGARPMAVRTSLFALLTWLPGDLADLSVVSAPALWPARWALYVANFAGIVLILSPMRARNGYQGLHEVKSGTRVVWRPWVPRRRPVRHRLPAHPSWVTTRPEGMPEAIGPYNVRGVVRSEPGLTILLGEDASLGRAVWIELRAESSAAPSPARQALARSTRLRWLSGGTAGASRWDAFLAPAGCPLAELVRGTSRLVWHDVRPILGSLVAELVAASRDGTWPGALELDQAWVQPSGEVLLLDPLRAGSDPPSGQPPGAGEQQEAVRLLHRVAALALQGRGFTDGSGPIRAAVPLHAAAILTGLGDGATPYGDVEQVRAALDATHDLPAEIDPTARAVYPIAFAVLFVAKFLAGFALVRALGKLDPIFSLAHRGTITHWFVLRGSVVVIGIPALVWILWAWITRGGLGGRLLGVMLLGPDGRPPSRWRCAWRETLMWLPLVGLIVAEILTSHLGWLSRPSLLVVIGAPAWVLADAAHAWFCKGRLLHDRLARVYAVPR
jgi:hypothetical protein